MTNLTNDTLEINSQDLLIQPEVKKIFFVADELDWKTIYSPVDYQEHLKEDLRDILLKLLNESHQKVRIDLNNITMVDTTYLNAMMGFADAHKELFPGGLLEMKNVHKDVLAIFKLVNLTELYMIPQCKD